MRVVLVLCLLAFMSCQRDIIDISKCLYESPKVQELIGDAIVAIVTKDFSKLLQKILDSLPELIQTVIKCVTSEKEVQEEVNLQGTTFSTVPCPMCPTICAVLVYKIKSCSLLCQNSCKKIL